MGISVGAFLVACEGPASGVFEITVENRTEQTVLFSALGNITEVPPREIIRVGGSLSPEEWDASIEFLVQTLEGKVLYRQFMSINQLREEGSRIIISDELVTPTPSQER
jgi:hypothetical protein